MSDGQRSIWYEHGLRPAIISLLGHPIASQWPPTYETERIRAKQANGRFSLGTKIIPREAVANLADVIRTSLEYDPDLPDGDKEWARDFFFLHTVRGTKHSSFHQVDADSARHYLNLFIIEMNLSYEVPEVGDWYIDVAIELSSEEGACLQWMTATHDQLVQQALQIPGDVADTITSLGSSSYSRDMNSHLVDISGFRITPGRNSEGPFRAAYVQAYTTDKTLVYNTDGRHHAKFITTKDAMGEKEPHDKIKGIHTIYDEASGVNSSNARLKVRVPYAFATEVLLEFTPHTIRESLCSFTREDWW